MKHTCTTIHRCVSDKEDLILLNLQPCSDQQNIAMTSATLELNLRTRVARTSQKLHFSLGAFSQIRLMLASARWCARPHGKQLHQEKTPPWARARPGSCFRFTQIRLQLKRREVSIQRNLREARLGPSLFQNSAGLTAPPEETHNRSAYSTFPKLNAGNCRSWSGQR